FSRPITCRVLLCSCLIHISTLLVISFSFFFYCYCPPPDLHSFPTRRSSDLCNPASPLRFRSISGMAADYTKPLQLAADNPRAIFATIATRDDYRGADQFVIRVIPARGRSQSYPNDARRR